MARKSRQSFLKRQREARRAEKAALKRQKRMERRQKAGEEGDVEGGGGPPIEAFEDSPNDESLPADGPPIDESLPAPEPLPEETPVEREG